MKQLEKIIMLLIISLCISNINYAQNSYKQQQKLERKAKKIHKRLNIDQNRVMQLLQMDKQETKTYIKFLKKLDTSNDDAMMEFSTEKILQMKTDCKYYANKAARKRNRILLGGLGAYISGVALICVGTEDVADCPPLLFTGIGIGAIGFGTSMYEYIKVITGNDLGNKLYRTSRTLIVENPVRPMYFEIGKDSYLQAGATIMRDIKTNNIAVGPSIAITF